MNASWVLLLSLGLLIGGQMPGPASIEQAVKQLGDEDFQTRERATEYLINTGAEAKAAVEAAAKSTDPEVVLRAKIILKRLASGIGPNTPPEIIALLDDFQAADRSRRSTIVYRLAQPAEFRAIWPLIAREPAGPDRIAMETTFRSRLTEQVSQNYRADKLREAEQLLLAGTDDPRSEAALVMFQQMTGTLPQTIDGLKKELAEKPTQPGWRRLALAYRATGDLPAAREAAEKLSDQGTSLWLAAEAGDWPAALRINRGLYEGGEPTVEQLAFTLLLSHYAHDEESLAAATAELQKRAAARPEDTWPVAEALLVAEQFDEGIELLEKSVPAAAFYLHWYRTQYDEAFALAGVQEGVTLDKAWFDALPDGNLVPTGLTIKRHYYANDIAGCLNYVGRRDEARQVVALLRQSAQSEPAGSSAWTALVAADLRLGMRVEALADAADALKPTRVRRLRPTR